MSRCFCWCEQSTVKCARVQAGRILLSTACPNSRALMPPRHPEGSTSEPDPQHGEASVAGQNPMRRSSDCRCGPGEWPAQEPERDQRTPVRPGARFACGAPAVRTWRTIERGGAPAAWHYPRDPARHYEPIARSSGNEGPKPPPRPARASAGGGHFPDRALMTRVPLARALIAQTHSESDAKPTHAGRPQLANLASYPVFDPDAAARQRL